MNINEEVETDRDETLHNRLQHAHQSKGAKIGWKRHRSSYNRANRKKERDCMNKTFYGIAKELEETMNEATIEKDNIFDYHTEISFDTIAGGIGVSIDDKSGSVSISTAMIEEGSGNYKHENPMTNEEEYKNLYNNLKDDINVLCGTFDQSMQQILAKYGLKPTE